MKLGWAEAMNDVMDFFDYMYRTVGVVDVRVYRPHHVEIRSIYAHLAGRFPDAAMADCFDLVQDVLEFTNTDSSVYPYPDGREWTDAEIKKYVEWRNRNEQSN